MTKPRAALWFVSAGVAIQFAGAIESEMDPISSPMKAKGVGELGLCGVAASLANAVYNATGCVSGIIRSPSTNSWIVCPRWRDE